MEDKDLKKGENIAEPGIAISEFIEKINKLSYYNFPDDEVLKFLRKNPLSRDFLEPYLFFSDVRYTRNLIHKTPGFELLILCWKPGQHTTIHDHGGQRCWMRVEQGCLKIIDYKQDKSSPMLVKKIDAYVTDEGDIKGPLDIHEVENTKEQDALSLLLSIPCLEKHNVYDIESKQKREMRFGYHSVHGKLIAPEETR